MKEFNQTNETKQVYETPVCEIVEVGYTQMLAASQTGEGEEGGDFD